MIVITAASMLYMEALVNNHSETSDSGHSEKGIQYKTPLYKGYCSRSQKITSVLIVSIHWQASRRGQPLYKGQNIVPNASLSLHRGFTACANIWIDNGWMLIDAPRNHAWVSCCMEMNNLVPRLLPALYTEKIEERILGTRLGNDFKW